MSKIVVIPDIHLKPYMFDYAELIMKSANTDTAVFLGDLVDEWNQENNVSLYRSTISRAIQFKQNHPKSLFCWGNHDIGYYAEWYCSGNSKLHRFDIIEMLKMYEKAVEPKYIQVIDDVIFSHAGIDNLFAQFVITNQGQFKGAQDIADLINTFSVESMGDSSSPLWLRPDAWTEYYNRYTQFVGHSPVKRLSYYNNVWFTDTFSKGQNNENICKASMVVFDTDSYELSIYDCTKNSPEYVETITRMYWDKYDINGD